MFTWFFLADTPASAWYLKPEEKELLILRLERQTGYTKSAQEFSKEDMILGLKDWKIWIFGIGQFGSITMLYGYSVFLPSIIKSK